MNERLRLDVVDGEALARDLVTALTVTYRIPAEMEPTGELGEYSIFVLGKILVGYNQIQFLVENGRETISISLLEGFIQGFCAARGTR